MSRRRLQNMRLGVLACFVAGLVLLSHVAAAGAQSNFSRFDSQETTYPSRFGTLTSRRWAYEITYQRSNLDPVANPDPAPEPQPHRDRPFDVVVSNDGKKAYVTLLGSELEPGSEVAVYDAAAEKIVARILLKPKGEVGPPASGPYRMAMHPGGRFLVVSNLFSNFASVIDTRTDIVV